MVVIRLARHGAKKRPFYRIVVADQRKKRDGRIIEQVGTYDPNTDPSTIALDLDKADKWIAQGAQPSERVAKIIAIKRNERDTSAAPDTAATPTDKVDKDDAAVLADKDDAADTTDVADADKKPSPEADAQ